MTRLRTCRLLAVALPFVAVRCGVARSDDGSPGEPKKPDPGERISARAAGDAALLLPQVGLGGSDNGSVTPNPSKLSEFKVEAAGCEKMTGYLVLPDGLDPARKHACIFVFHGNGDVGKWRTQIVGNVTTARDPVIACGIQYQELLADGKGKMGLPALGSNEDVLRAARWILDKVMKEQPVDPERVFVSGFSWGTAWASSWCNAEWERDKAKFPFRACFLYSSGGAGTKESIPPIPFVCTVGGDELAAKGNFEVLPAVRHYANVLLSLGKTCQYHEVPKMGHDVNGRCLQITRDTINALGGPGALPYPPAAGEKAPQPDPLPFKSEDARAQEVIALCAGDDWAGARARLASALKDKKPKLPDKQPLHELERELDRFAREELARLDKLMARALKDAQAPPAPQLRRYRALALAWKDELFVKLGKYVATAEKLEGDDFPPSKRERERGKMMRDALALESSPGKRAEAKQLYTDLAARKSEDGAASAWPRAAEYRLSWWIDG